MAVLNLDYYQNTDRYSDGEIEETLLSYVKGVITWEQLEKTGDMYPVLYHLSPMRENIINWYPFRKNASVLEIGSGCGALTGMLCEKAEKVVSAELSKRRASINFERHKESDNLTIMVGNLNDMAFDAAFDYVVLNGVLEYAMSFTEGDTPYETFLNKMKGFLKPEGHLLIAIENRLGLKYFNGAPEDHTGHYYEGIDGYTDNNTVRTFSKAELSRLLDSCGLTEKNFYYPYPDYKFPTEIFTDQSLLKQHYGKGFLNLDEKRYRIFEEQGMWNALAKEGVTDAFANSFLVDAACASPKKAPEREILYVKLNNDREACFRIATSIERHMGEKIVVKSPLTEEARAHIQTLMNSMELTPNPKFVNLAGTLSEDGSIYYPYLRSGNLDSEMEAFIEEGRIDEILKTLRQVFGEYGRAAAVSDAYQTEDFMRIFGPAPLDMALPCVQPANIDLICDNIFRENEEYRIIDCEWVFDMPTPVPFIIWRSVNELYTKHRKLSRLMERGQMMLEFDIDEKMSHVFWQWAMYFAREYVGSGRLERYVKPMKLLSVDDMVAENRRNSLLCGSLFYDTGDGFCEEQKLYRETVMDGEAFAVSFELEEICQKAEAEDKKIVGLRWDPLEEEFCSCRIKSANVKLIPMNADVTDEDVHVFLTTDPVYYIEAEPIPSVIRIEGQLHRLTEPELSDYIDERMPLLRWQGSDLQSSMKKQQEEIDRLNEKQEELQAAYDQLQMEKAAVDRQHGQLIDDFWKLRTEYEQAVKELEEIHASRSWKLLNKLKGN